MLVENLEKKHIVNVWQLIYLAGQLVVLFAPLSALLVRNLTVVPAMRILYSLAFLSMTVKFYLVYKYAEEPAQGKRRMEETKKVSLFFLLGGYGTVLKSIFKSGDIIKAAMLFILINIGMNSVSMFFGLYTTQNLGLPQETLAYLPILRAVIMLLFFFGLTQRLERIPFKAPMIAGIIIVVISQVLLILSANIETAVYPRILLVISLEAFGLAMVLPRRESLIAVFILPRERARMTSIINALMTVVVMPFGYIAGWLSGMDRRLPFGMAVAVMLVALVLVMFMKINMQQDADKKLGDA
jgi:Na+/melibiose symporter-like transporter